MRRPIRTIPISTRQWPETSAVAAPTCACAKPSSLPRGRLEPMLRRDFLKASAVVGGGLVIGFHLPFVNAAGAEAGVFAPNAFIRIDRRGKITLIMPQSEMGQGVYTAIAMILAEELDAAFDQVTLQAAPPSDKLYGNPFFHIQVTGNSNSIRAFWPSLRKAGAGARALLVNAAARTWKVDPATCRTDSSQ